MSCCGEKKLFARLFLREEDREEPETEVVGCGGGKVPVFSATMDDRRDLEMDLGVRGPKRVSAGRELTPLKLMWDGRRLTAAVVIFSRKGTSKKGKGKKVVRAKNL